MTPETETLETIGTNSLEEYHNNDADTDTEDEGEEFDRAGPQITLLRASIPNIRWATELQPWRWNIIGLKCFHSPSEVDCYTDLSRGDEVTSITLKVDPSGECLKIRRADCLSKEILRYLNPKFGTRAYYRIHPELGSLVRSKVQSGQASYTRIKREDWDDGGGSAGEHEDDHVCETGEGEDSGIYWSGSEGCGICSEYMRDGPVGQLHWNTSGTGVGSGNGSGSGHRQGGDEGEGKRIMLGQIYAHEGCYTFLAPKDESKAAQSAPLDSAISEECTM